MDDEHLYTVEHTYEGNEFFTVPLTRDEALHRMSELFADGVDRVTVEIIHN